MNEDISKLKKSIAVNRILLLLVLIILLAFLGAGIYGGLTAVKYVNEITPTIETLKSIDVNQISEAVNTLSEIDPNELKEMGENLESIDANLKEAMVEVEELNNNMETITQYINSISAIFR